MATLPDCPVDHECACVVERFHPWWKTGWTPALLIVLCLALAAWLIAREMLRSRHAQVDVRRIQKTPSMGASTMPEPEWEPDRAKSVPRPLWEREADYARPEPPPMAPGSVRADPGSVRAEDDTMVYPEGQDPR
jgi:hypothetical protein